MVWEYEIGKLATAVFSITGVLAAGRHNMDIFGIVVIGLVTAIGGGTVRDLILNTEVFWVRDFSYVWIAILAAIIAFFLEGFFRNTYSMLLYLDAFGVAMFAIQAINKTIDLGLSFPVAVVMGLITGIIGGVLRDMLTNQPNLLMKKELYATPILFGGILYVILIQSFPAFPLNGFIGITLIFGLRVAAIFWGLTVPNWLLFKSYHQ